MPLAPIVSTEEDLANTPPDALTVFVSGNNLVLPDLPNDPEDESGL